jgi:hypothetical protein
MRGWLRNDRPFRACAGRIEMSRPGTLPWRGRYWLGARAESDWQARDGPAPPATVCVYGLTLSLPRCWEKPMLRDCVVLAIEGPMLRARPA